MGSIGSAYPMLLGNYIGLIDEVAPWKVVLNKNEVQEVMKRGLDVEPTNKLSTRWRVII